MAARAREDAMDEKLRQSLQSLQDELHKAQPADAPGRKQVEQLKGDVRAALDQPALPAHYHSLAERLREAVSHFEEQHPSLTSAAESVIDQLARMGI